MIKMEKIVFEKNKIKLMFKPFDQGMLNAINKKIWEDKSVKKSGFQVTHPEVGEAIFTLETEKTDAKKIWNNAVAELKKQFKEISN
mgnify:FL=1|tara:strand:+ start:263 stop:520 length:258 start_codon:yes stop_codon:yes gene_type:complete